MFIKQFKLNKIYEIKNNHNFFSLGNKIEGDWGQFVSNVLW